MHSLWSLQKVSWRWFRLHAGTGDRLALVDRGGPYTGLTPTKCAPFGAFAPLCACSSLNSQNARPCHRVRAAGPKNHKLWQRDASVDPPPWGPASPARLAWAELHAAIRRMASLSPRLPTPPVLLLAVCGTWRPHVGLQTSVQPQESHGI